MVQVFIRRVGESLVHLGTSCNESGRLFERSDLSVRRDFDLFRGFLVAIPAGLIIWVMIALIVLCLAQ